MQIQVKTGSGYIAELFDRLVPYHNEDGRFDDLLDKANWINNLECLADELKAELTDLPTGQKQIKLLKRLEIIEAFRASGNNPAWMILDIVPVIPPDIRPMVMLDGGRNATTDLNDH
jgi:DNA-directed RNA polymerase subunit beta'